ncbi:MAG: hypothetical protein NWF00_10205 [Candidatus Bathyarchaeota archaeon]|nr:hypothetical protein [Candidatus Bathyarchaeota archaeon]
MITGLPTSEAASKTAKYGADAFLTKPVRPYNSFGDFEEKAGREKNTVLLATY